MLLRAIVFLLLTHVAFGEDWTTIRRSYYQAVEGNREAGARAAESIDTLRRSKPDDPVLLVYRGSLHLLQSSWTIAPWRKGKLAKEGLNMMDRAVAFAPRNLEVRFVRAASTMRLPAFFNRTEQSIADFAEIAPHVGAAVRAGKLEARLGSATLHHHALNREKAGDADAANQACVEAVHIGPGTPGAKACKTWLSADGH